MPTSRSKAATSESSTACLRCSVAAWPSVDSVGKACDKWCRPKMSTNKNAAAIGSLPSRHLRLADRACLCSCSVSTVGRNRNKSRVSSGVSACMTTGTFSCDFRRWWRIAAISVGDAFGLTALVKGISRDLERRRLSMRGEAGEFRFGSGPGGPSSILFGRYEAARGARHSRRHREQAVQRPTNEADAILRRRTSQLL